MEYQEICPLGKGYVPQEDLLSGKVSFTGTSTVFSHFSQGEEGGCCAKPCMEMHPQKYLPGAVVGDANTLLLLSSIQRNPRLPVSPSWKWPFFQSCLTAGSDSFFVQFSHAHFESGMGSSKTKPFQLLLRSPSGWLAQSLALHLQGLVFSTFQKHT